MKWMAILMKNIYVEFINFYLMKFMILLVNIEKLIYIKQLLLQENEKIKEFIGKETVLCVAAACAIFTMFLVPPDPEYLHYIDFRVLCLLLCRRRPIPIRCTITLLQEQRPFPRRCWSIWRRHWTSGNLWFISK